MTTLSAASQARLAWAKELAVVYAGHPDLVAIVVGGSTARGTAGERSDLDLGLFWTRLPTVQERAALVTGAGGRLVRAVDNQLRFSAANPRQVGVIEQVELKGLPAAPALTVDLEHETVSGTEQVLDQVLDGLDLSLEKQELLAVIESGLALHGHDQVARWRERTSRYPVALASRMVTLNLQGVAGRLEVLVLWLEAEEWFLLHQGVLDIGRRLLLALFGLNRTWAFTDNPGFKGFATVVGGLPWKPDRFERRLGRLLQSDARLAILGLADLSGEILALAEGRLPGLDLAAERLRLQDVRRRLGS